MGEWDEGSHPRDADGRFGTGGDLGAAKGLRAFAAKHAPGGMLAKVGRYNKEAHPEAHAAMRGTVDRLTKTIANGSLNSSMTLGEHISNAKTFLADHAKGLDAALAKLKTLAPADATVKGRVKDLQSTLEKLVRKPKYKTADQLQDGSGMRIVAHSIKDVETTVAKIRDNYKIVGEDNYLHQPQGDYRSHHLIVEDHDGLQKEVQVRTKNQDDWADWGHQIYKPHDEAQTSAMEHHGDLIRAYSKAMTDHFYARDMGKVSARPRTPAIVKKHFGEPGAPKYHG